MGALLKGEREAGIKKDQTQLNYCMVSYMKNPKNKIKRQVIGRWEIALSQMGRGSRDERKGVRNDFKNLIGEGVQKLEGARREGR